MTATTYTATYNGQVIGTRKSPRAYAFAVIYQRDEVRARTYASRPADKTDRSNFEFYTAVSTGFWNGRERNADEVAEAKTRIEGGFESYVARERAAELAQLEKSIAAGEFQPKVFGWSMSARAVKGMESQAARFGRYLATVPAVAK